MKKLYLIGGTMGVGKTSTCQILKMKLQNSVFLDGDWCWDMHSFQVTGTGIGIDCRDVNRREVKIIKGLCKRQPLVLPVRSELWAVPYEVGRTLSGLRRRRGKLSCKIARCSIQHGKIEYRNQCQEFPCDKNGRADEYDIFITHRNWNIEASVGKPDAERRVRLCGKAI